MNATTVFIVASIVVLIALILSLGFWIQIWKHTTNTAKQAARYFVICFTLYSIGQSIALLQGMNVLRGWWSVSSYLYALAALLFAIGSSLQYRSVKK